MNQYKIIPEHIIEEASLYLIALGEPDNNFARLLEVADEYRQANLTPIFLLKNNISEIECSAKELMSATFH